MNFLVVGINFWPEKTGIGKYTGQMCEWLSTQGHKVNVITSMPYYPEWQIHEKYRRKLFLTEDLKGIKIHRSWLYVPVNLTGKSRIIHEVSFLLTSLIYHFKFIFKKNDVVILISPPFYFSALAFIYRRKNNIIINHIQDLQVDAAEKLNILTNAQFLKLLKLTERVGLNRCNIISTLSENMKSKIIEKGIIDHKIRLFPNWVDIDFFVENMTKYDFRQLWSFQEDDFIVLYSGNIGEKQGLEILVEIVKEIEEYDPSIKFVLVGEGANKQELLRSFQMQNASNVFFFPLQPYSMLPSLLAFADTHLVLQKKNAADLLLPSKLNPILAVGGLPIISADQDTFLHEINLNYKIGLIIEPENKTELKNAILKSRNLKIRNLSKNNKKFVMQFSKDGVLSTFFKEFTVE